MAKKDQFENLDILSGPPMPPAEWVDSIRRGVVPKPSEPEVVEGESNNKVITKYKQSNNKVITKYKQSNNKVVTQNSKSDNKVVTKVVTEISFEMLSGVQKKFVILIADFCQENRSVVTGPLTIGFIIDEINCSIGTAKTTINRLIKKGYLFRNSFRTGRGGWSKYSLLKPIYDEILRHKSNNKVITKWEQSDIQSDNKLVTNTPSSSIYNKTKKVEEGLTKKKKIILPTNPLPLPSFLPEMTQDWLDIDFDELNKLAEDCPKHSGSTMKHDHLKSLFRARAENSLTPEMVQDLISRISHGIRIGVTEPENIVNFFMKCLINGTYNTPAGYLTPAERRRQIFDAGKEQEFIKQSVFEAKYFEEWLVEIMDKDYDLSKIPIFAYDPKKTFEEQNTKLKIYFIGTVLEGKLREINLGKNNDIEIKPTLNPKEPDSQTSEPNV